MPGAEERRRRARRRSPAGGSCRRLRAPTTASCGRPPDEAPRPAPGRPRARRADRRDSRPRRCWRRSSGSGRAVAGERFARAAEPVSERDGVVTVACESAVWAQELDLMSERVVEAPQRGARQARRAAPAPAGRAAPLLSTAAATPNCRDLQHFRDARAAGSGGLACYNYVHVKASPRPRADTRSVAGASSCERRRHLAGNDGTNGTASSSARATTPRTSRSSRASRPSASVPACTSARPVCAACTTWSTRSSTTRSTRRSPAAATPSRSRSTRTTPSPSSTTAAASPSRSWRRRRSRPPRSC